LYLALQVVLGEEIREEKLNEKEAKTSFVTTLSMQQTQSSV